MKKHRLFFLICMLVLTALAWAQTQPGNSSQISASQLASTEPISSGSVHGWFRWDAVALALLGAAIASFVAGMGSAIGITTAANMAQGALQEKPELFGKFIPLAAAPGTQGVYGLVVSVLILGKIVPEMTTDQGWHLFFASIPVGIVGMISAIYQGKVCAGGIGLSVKDPANLGRALVMAALVEFYALLGLLTSILMLGKY